VTDTLQFGPGQTQATFSVPILGHAAAAGSKTIQLTLSAPTGDAPLGTFSTAFLVIRDGVPAPPANLGAAAVGFAHSVEHYGAFVITAYQRYLGRLPDPAGYQGWVAQMQQGLSDERLEADFIGSPEYIADHGGTGAAWVRGMYQDLLGRTPSSAEVDAWVKLLSGGMAPASVAYGFAASAEREGQRVRDDYLTYLGRAPSQAEVNAWVQLFTQGDASGRHLSNEDVIAGFVGSVEYYQSPTRGKGDEVDWIFSAYQDVLHRFPTSDEVTAWGRFLG
jgi:hypothetical protein